MQCGETQSPAEDVLSLPPPGSCKRPLILGRVRYCRRWWEPEVWTHIPVPPENPDLALNFVDSL